jgi:triphosphatase
MVKTQQATSPRHEPTETELKLFVSPADGNSLTAHPALNPPNASEPRSEHIVTTYFDTPRRDLAGHGYSLRVRANGERIQTLKSSDSGGAIKSRGEWEWPVKSDHPDLDLIAETPAAHELLPDVGRKLQPIVVTDVERTVRRVEFEGSTIEAALDAGSIIAGDDRQPVSELELELREGKPAALYRLALSLHAVTPLSVETESKAERGYRLRDLTAPTPKEAAPVELADDVEAGAALRLIVSNALGHLLSNKPAVLAGDTEGIHQARVAISRLRSALLLFKPCLEPHALADFQRELQRMGRVAGAARDWDVICLEILPRLFSETDEIGYGGLMREAAEARRRAADATWAHEMEAPTFTALVLGLSASTESVQQAGGGLGDEGLQKRLSRTAAELLDRMADKVDKRGRGISPDASPAELHPLRKSLKKLRYSVEFLSSCYSRKDVKHFLRPMKDLQKTLGAINDAATAIRLTEELAEQRTELMLAVAALAKNLDQTSVEARERLGKEWDAFQRQERFWR